MSDPVLEVEGARPVPGSSSLQAPFHLRLEPGALALMDSRDGSLARALVELCTGLTPLAEGRVRFLGREWAGLKRREAEALRARIGLAPGEGGWLPHLSVMENTLLARRHHGGVPDEALLREAEELARRFGLHGLPRVSPHEMSRIELAQAGCIRAFLGRPALVLLESPLDIEVSDALVAPLRGALEPALAAGAAAIWVTRSRRAWEDPTFPAAQRYRLGPDGLEQAKAREREAVP